MTFFKTVALASVCALSLIACGNGSSENPTDSNVFDSTKTDMHIIDWVNQELAAGHDVNFADPLDTIGADFTQLALRLGQLDGDYVDAYHGPKAWKDEAAKTTPDPEKLANDIKTLHAQLDKISTNPGPDNIRKSQMSKLMRAMAVRLDVIQGKPVTFDTEVAEIYDVAPPVYDMAKFDDVLSKIDALLPGDGTTADRVNAFRDSLAIPKDKLQPIFDRAIEECKTRTMAHYDLPEGEKFRMEFVTDKSWSGYNYYQGDYESLIQINTDFPIIIDRAVDLGCHEGYPGHHVWNLFTERDIVGERGWIEYSVNPLFGPFGPIAEGTGNYGIKLAFPGTEKIEFERGVLYPMAGLDPAKAAKLTELNALTSQLSQATNEVSRQYLDGEISKEDAAKIIQKYYLQTAEKSAQRIRFVDKYRAYVINYNIGQDWVKAYVTAAGDDPDAQWEAFRELLVTPMTTSDIEKSLEK